MPVERKSLISCRLGLRPACERVFILLIVCFFMWNFRSVDAWDRAVNLSKTIYELSKVFPDDEKYGLTSQIRRAIVSVSSNIAEGCGRRTSKDFVGFLHNAMGSVKEVESELFVAEKLGYIEMKDVERLFDELEEIGRMISGMVRREGERGVT